MSGEEAAPRPSPYRGLEPFDERDAPFFFGRTRETRLIVASLFAAPFTLFYGASGVGKSSVLRAGVLPRLRERSDLLPVVFPAFTTEAEGSRTSVLRGWQADPVGGLKETTALALFAAAGGDDATRARFQDAVTRYEMAPLREFLAACHAVSGRRLMVILDQFEEYSLYHPEDEAFAAQLPACIVPGDLSVSFLVSLREDALAKIDRFKGLIPTLWDSYRRIDHLDRAAATDAVRLPLGEHNRRLPPGAQPVTIEDALVDAVLRDVETERVQFDVVGAGGADRAPGTGRIETPYLQLVMTRLWEREQTDGSATLRLATLQSEGGGTEIVRTHLDRVMAQFTPEEQDVAARVFHRLVTPSGAKIAFSVSVLAAYETVAPEELTPILRQLEAGSRRILRRIASRHDALDEPRYEIFHDRLGRAILSWRAKRLTELARDSSQRQEAEQQQLASAARESLSEEIDATMSRLSPASRAAWAQMLIYLVTASGVRLILTVERLAELSRLPLDTVGATVQELVEVQVLREAYGDDDDSTPGYVVVNDELASGLLAWHSRYVRAQATAAPRRGLAPRRETRTVPTEIANPRDERLYARVRHALRTGTVVPFIGSGVPLSARPSGTKPTTSGGPFLPSGWEFKELLARRCEFPANELEASDVAAVASYFVHKQGRARLDVFLHETLGLPDQPLSDTHLLLADVARSTPLLIFTTNYDRLMEQALTRAGVPHDVASYANEDARLRYRLVVDGMPVIEPVPDLTSFFDGERTQLVRLHGPSSHKDGTPSSSYLVTEEDQIEWLMHSQRSRFRLVRAKAQSRSLLSLGHSARDWSQRAMLREFDQFNLHREGWAIALNPDPLSIMTWQRYGLEILNTDLNTWAARMREDDFPPKK